MCHLRSFPVAVFFALLTLLSGTTHAETNADASVTADTAQADRHFSEGEFRKAADLYRKSLAADPADNRNRFLLACLLFELDLYDDASTEFMNIVASSENAETAALLAHLCRRRADDPNEPVSKSVHAVLLPAATNIPPQQGAWNDDTFSGLTADLLLKQGIFRIDQDRLDALFRAYPDDLDIAIGAAILSPKSWRAEMLHQAQSRFPDSPVIPMLRLLSLPKDVEHQSAALPFLDTMIRLDPDNALPRLMRHYLDDPDFPFIEGRPKPWNAQAVRNIDSACGFPRFNTYAAEKLDASRKTLQALNYPLRLRLISSDTPIQVTLNMIPIPSISNLALEQLLKPQSP